MQSSWRLNRISSTQQKRKNGPESHKTHMFYLLLLFFIRDSIQHLNWCIDLVYRLSCLPVMRVYSIWYFELGDGGRVGTRGGVCVYGYVANMCINWAAIEAIMFLVYLYMFGESYAIYKKDNALVMKFFILYLCLS